MVYDHIVGLSRIQQQEFATVNGSCYCREDPKSMSSLSSHSRNEICCKTY